MKNMILALVICLISTPYSNAQWYFRSCGVIDITNTTPDELECIWKKTNRTFIVGAIITGVGILTCAAGFGYAVQSIGSYQGDYLATIAYKLWIFAGATTVIGIPILITGTVRKSQLRKIPHYINLKSGALNLTPLIGLNEFSDTHYLGMGLSLRF
jgi:hypothetical protein